MSFAPQLKIVPTEETFPERDPLWSVNDLRVELCDRKVWTASIPGNTECWHKQLLPHVTSGDFTFNDFVEVFSAQSRFDFSVALAELLKPEPPLVGGWYNSELAD